MGVTHINNTASQARMKEDAPLPKRPRRPRRRLLLIGTLVVALFAVAGVYWFQPQKLFIDDKVSETLPPSFTSVTTTTKTVGPTTPAPTVSAPIAATAPIPGPVTTAVPATSSTAASATTAPVPAAAPPDSTTPTTAVTDIAIPAPVPTTAIAETVAPAPAPTTTAATGVAGPVEIGRGGFRSLEHKTSGSAIAYAAPDGSRLLRLEDFDTSNGPDLRVILSSAPASDDWRIWGNDYVELARLKGNVGSQNYQIPADVDLSRYGRVVIWCVRFKVGFGVADINSA
jgi:cytoskeletal protein RodZ